MSAPPILDFAPFYSDDVEAKQKLVDDVRAACRAKGFFQIINHGVPFDLQTAIFEQSKDFFALPKSEKTRLDKATHPNLLGYEALRSQNFEGKPQGDLKEGFFIGRKLASDHPWRDLKRIHCGQNVYPDTVSDPARFEQIVDAYHTEMTRLAHDLLKAIALTLDQETSYFDDFCEQGAAVLRLLHYPPQQPTSTEERGIGAHTDFGAITILLQDSVGGLQVYDIDTATWIDVEPHPGALVVNLGNLMMRWSNDVYQSNLHRVINTSGKERYSIPFFFGGNPDYVIDILPGCETAVQKYAPVRGEDWIMGRHTNTFGTGKGEKELRQALAQAAATTVPVSQAQTSQPPQIPSWFSSYMVVGPTAV